MRENEKKRQIEEKKRKRKQAPAKKAGDPEDMTIAILSEILTKSGVPFKTSDEKQVLINKVRDQRNKRQNLTESTEVDICLQATITQEVTEKGISTEADSRLGNDLAGGSEQLLNSVLNYKQNAVFKLFILILDGIAC